jgi:hypothetical protein
MFRQSATTFHDLREFAVTRFHTDICFDYFLVIYKIIKLFVRNREEDSLIAEMSDFKANRMTYFSTKVKGSEITAVTSCELRQHSYQPYHSTYKSDSLIPRPPIMETFKSDRNPFTHMTKLYTDTTVF